MQRRRIERRKKRRDKMVPGWREGEQQSVVDVAKKRSQLNMTMTFARDNP
jgi:hypothetical protein